jgi:hypothetical protein
LQQFFLERTELQQLKQKSAKRPMQVFSELCPIIVFLIFLYILIILQIYTIVSKFIKNKHQSQWATAATTEKAYRRRPRRPNVTANGRVQGVGPTAPYCRAPRRLEVRPPWATTVGHFRHGGSRAYIKSDGGRRPSSPSPAALKYVLFFF